MNALIDRVFHLKEEEYSDDAFSDNDSNTKDISKMKSASMKNKALKVEIRHERAANKKNRTYDAALEKKLLHCRSKAFTMEVKTKFYKSESENLKKEIEVLGAIFSEILHERDQAILNFDTMKDECNSLEEQCMAIQMEMEEVKFINDGTSKLVVDQLKMHHQMLLLQKEQEIVELRKMALENEKLKKEFQSLMFDKQKTKSKVSTLRAEIDEAGRISQKLTFDNDELNSLMNNVENDMVAKSKTNRFGIVSKGFKKLFIKETGKRNSIVQVVIKRQRNSICEYLDQHTKNVTNSLELTIGTVKNGEYIDIPRIVTRRLSLTG